MEEEKVSGGSHEQRVELADLLIRHREEVERLWMARVGKELNRHGVTETELRDSIPDYLESIANGLRRAGYETMIERGVEAWVSVARQHALTRIRLGFDIGEIIQEFLILRSVILEVLSANTRLSLDQGERIHSLISGALRASVKSYVDHRDYQSRADQAKHIGFITHELRNPLSTAMVTAGQLRKLAPQSAELARHLDLLDRSHRRMRTLIDDTLLSQQLEVHEVQSHPTEVRLGELLDHAIKGAEAKAKLKGVEFDITVENPDVLLRVDLKLATSALENVVDNAAKFTDRGRVLVKVEEASADVFFHVFDECEGLAPEELQTIFEPFKRGHSGKSGTGLGLAIARQAVEAHGKTIHAEATGEHGCHFWFALPKATH